MQYERTLTTMPRSPYTSGGRSLAGPRIQHSATCTPHHLDHGRRRRGDSLPEYSPSPPGKIGFEHGASPTDVMSRSSAGLGTTGFELAILCPPEARNPSIPPTICVATRLRTVLLVPGCRLRCRHHCRQLAAGPGLVVLTQCGLCPDESPRRGRVGLPTTTILHAGLDGILRVWRSSTKRGRFEPVDDDHLRIGLFTGLRRF